MESSKEVHVKRRWRFLVSAVLVVLVVAGFAAALVPARAAPLATTTVKVTLLEMKFVMTKKTVPHGKVVFKVTNKGKLPHDFKIARKKTPVLAPGKSATLAVTFRKAGSYPFVCTVPGHAAAGMKGVLKVR